MQTVAQRAGVSLATVSHVLNGTRYVSAETTALVQRAVEEIGYVPNTIARDLARNSTSTIGLVFSLTVNAFFLDIISAIEKECRRVGLSVLLFDSNDDPAKEYRIVRDLHQRRVDGIILAPSAGPDSAALDYLHEQAVPAVLVDRLADPRFDQVGLDNREAVRLLTDHLIGLGHRRIAMIPGHGTYTTTMERIDAFREALHAYGMLDERLITSPANRMEEAAANMSWLLDASGGAPDVVLAGNNLCTLGAMHEISRRGLKVPGDIALAGIDDFEWAESFEPRLTVVRQPCSAIGRTAADMIRRRVAMKDVPLEARRLRPELVVRRSCGHNGRG
ncbi:LacI family DNA-binding transcriptional regulator [Paracoccus caeni]|uniref:LacI family DNA-binding transcriptional regulator n=1 Tax=Paracoccus caeni TaxID=657651 RepID=A0A934SEP4_9RHOB|nr:LacI family DNA-binding transcriptional regulator [Paracoccus caeni]MBK4215606.1 LacI family DNA-binding transcriptional regulator [Paracoccus caeni]